MAATIFMEMPGCLKMPAIGLGTFQTSEAELETSLEAALELGYRHIDTAFSYENEPMVGRIIKKWISQGKLKREDLFITTKLPMPGVHQDRVEMFMKKSLNNLQLDQVDLYLIHFPIGTKYAEGQALPSPDNLETDITDHVAVWKTTLEIFKMFNKDSGVAFQKMEEQVDAGRTKTIGVSNFNVKQVDRILQSARIKPACLQVELHVYLQQKELVNFCHQNDIVVVAYAPLGSPGFNKFLGLFGKQPKKLPDMLHDVTIKTIADKYKKTNAQVMLRYLLQKDIAAIPKSVTAARLKENIDVFDFCMSCVDVRTLDGLEVGDEARVCDFKLFSGFPEHPEWPFPK